MVLVFDFVRHHPIGNSARDNDIVFGAIPQFAENTLQYAAAVKNKNNLIGAAVLVILEFVVCLRRLRAIRRHVLIEKHRDPSRVEIAAPGNRCSAQMMMTQRTISDLFQFMASQKLHIAHARRRTQMIHDRISLIESLRGEDMLVGNAFTTQGFDEAYSIMYHLRPPT